MSRLRELYTNKIKSELAKEFNIANDMAIPRITKVVVNVGVGRATQDAKYLTEAETAITAITGQKPVLNKARKSIAGFKLREGNPVGISVTLRGERMYEFIDRLVNATFPRIRDFRGVKANAFDGHGNYSVGIKEHTVFPELIGLDIAPISLQVNIATSAKNNEQAKALLTHMGFPFVKES
jgi:large subunit ribosomal protein L5